MVSWVQKLKVGNKKKRQNQMKRCLHKYKEISLKATNESGENNNVFCYCLPDRF